MNNDNNTTGNTKAHKRKRINMNDNDNIGTLILA